MNVDGSCVCGSIRLEAEIDLGQVFICHCTDCQQHSGTAFRTVAAIAPESLIIVVGTPKTYRKGAESGTERELGFCGDCGTSLFGRPVPGEPGVMSLRTGILRQRGMLRPQAQIWTVSAQPWVNELRDIPAIARQDPDEIARTAAAPGQPGSTTGPSLEGG